jgi:hypothetical protein
MNWFVITFALFAFASSALAQNSSTVPPTTVPGTNKYVVVGPKPEQGNPGKQITVTPDRFQTGGDNRTQPNESYGVTVTIPLGTIAPKK